MDNIKTLITAVILLSGGNIAHADDDTVTINVTGNIIAQPCQVDSGSKQINVDLGDIDSADVMTNGQVSTPKAFDIKLVNCPKGTSNVLATYTGTGDGGGWKNTGTATGVQLLLCTLSTCEYNSRISATSTKSYSVTEGSVTIPQWAAVYSSGDGMAGTLAATMTISFTYN